MSNDSQMFCHLANPNYLKLLNLLGLQFDSSDLEDFEPYKNCNNVAWHVQLLKRTGIDIENVPIFTDRGNLKSAAAAMTMDPLSITLNLKYCIEHIGRNIM